MASLQEYVEQTVSVVTNEGRVIVGTLRGFDQATNIILEECHERVYSEDKAVSLEPLGLYILRGDCVSVVGVVDNEIDARMDLSAVRAAPLNPVRH